MVWFSLVDVQAVSAAFFAYIPSAPMEILSPVKRCKARMLIMFPRVIWFFIMSSKVIIKYADTHMCIYLMVYNLNRRIHHFVISCYNLYNRSDRGHNERKDRLGQVPSDTNRRSR